MNEKIDELMSNINDQYHKISSKLSIKQEEWSLKIGQEKDWHQDHLKKLSESIFNYTQLYTHLLF